MVTEIWLLPGTCVTFISAWQYTDLSDGATVTTTKLLAAHRVSPDTGAVVVIT